MEEALSASNLAPRESSMMPTVSIGADMTSEYTPSKTTQRLKKNGDHANSLFCLYELLNPQDVFGSVVEGETSKEIGKDILSVVDSNMNTDSQAVLKEFITRRLSYNLIPEIRGDIAKLPSSSFFFHTICYFCLLRTQYSEKKDDREGIENDESVEESLLKHFTSVEKSAGRDYVVCLVKEIENDEGFDLFQSELDIFIEKFKSLLDREMMSNASHTITASGDIRRFLVRWYSDVVEYLSRAVESLGQSLPYFLHAALRGAKLSIEGPSSNDITRLFNSLQVLSNVSSTDDVLVLKIVDGRAEVGKGKKVNDFCMQWSQRISRKASDSLLLRVGLEDFKFRVNQDINQFKRAVTQAVNSNYALYSAYRFLSRNSNRDILLEYVKQDEQEDEVSYFGEIYEVLSDHLVDKEESLVSNTSTSLFEYYKKDEEEEES